MKFAASVVIPTRGRVKELHELLQSALGQTVPLEILVMDDGETDATGEMLRSDFPYVQHHRLGCGRGPAFQRNRGLQLATQPIAFPVDDDTLFVSPQTVAQTLAEFDHPRVAAVGIPFINVRQDQVVQQRASASDIQVAHAFVGAAHAVRREVFLKVGGYREHFYYMGEEGDLCLRLMGAGYVTRVGRAEPIHHLESTHRNLNRAGYYGRRNDVLFCWHNVPTPQLPFHLLGTTANGLRVAVSSGCFWPMLKGILSGYAGCWKHRQDRSPVTPAIYQLSRHLKKKGPLPLDKIEHLLPPLPR